MRLMVKVFFVLLFFCGASLAAAGEPYWIDVRTAAEYENGHVSSAVNIPYEELAERIGEVTDDPDALIYLYCRSGRRAGIALEDLEALGYSQVVNLMSLEAALEKAGETATP